MDTSNNRVYKDEGIAKQAIKAGLSKAEDVKQLPNSLQAEARMALNGQDSVKIPKNSVSPLAQFAQKERNAKKRKKKRNRTAGQSRKKNQR